jgi:precorrin-8X/cobalt-precorrin-8 methylmutase
MVDARESLMSRYSLPPSEIEPVSLRRVDLAIGDAAHWPAGEREVVRKLVYACGDPAIAHLVRASPGAVEAGVGALRRGCSIVVDVRMIEVAVDRRRASMLGCQVHCAIDAPAVLADAEARGLSRAAVAMQLLAGHMSGSLVIVGTAPTALLALLDMIDAGGPSPAAIVGMPVGFVAAAESKTELMAREVPYITVEGTRGGAGLAAAALNALLAMAADA